MKTTCAWRRECDKIGSAVKVWTVNGMCTLHQEFMYLLNEKNGICSVSRQHRSGHWCSLSAVSWPWCLCMLFKYALFAVIKIENLGGYLKFLDSDTAFYIYLVRSEFFAISIYHFLVHFWRVVVLSAFTLIIEFAACIFRETSADENGRSPTTKQGPALISFPMHFNAPRNKRRAVTRCPSRTDKGGRTSTRNSKLENSTVAVKTERNSVQLHRALHG